MFPKGGMGKLMKQAQEMQAKMAKAQEELGNIEAEGQSGGGMITALVNGKKELLSLKIVEFQIWNIEFHSKNGFHKCGIAPEKRNFRPGAGVPAVYPNQLGPSHYESFGISSKLDEGFFLSCLKVLH